MKKALYGLMSAALLFVSACSSGATNSSGNSSNGNLQVVSFEIDEQYREAGREFLEWYLNKAIFATSGRNFDTTNLYRYKEDQITRALVGKWNAIYDNGNEYIWEFTEDGEVSYCYRQSDKTYSEVKTGTWSIFPDDTDCIYIDLPDTFMDGLYRVYALQNDDRILLNRRWTDKEKSRDAVNFYALFREGT